MSYDWREIAGEKIVLRIIIFKEGNGKRVEEGDWDLMGAVCAVLVIEWMEKGWFEGDDGWEDFGMGKRRWDRGEKRGVAGEFEGIGREEFWIWFWSYYGDGSKKEVKCNWTDFWLSKVFR